MELTELFDVDVCPLCGVLGLFGDLESKLNLASIQGWPESSIARLKPDQVMIIACLAGWARLFEFDPADARAMMSRLVATGSFR